MRFRRQECEGERPRPLLHRILGDNTERAPAFILDEYVAMRELYHGLRLVRLGDGHYAYDGTLLSKRGDRMSILLVYSFDYPIEQPIVYVDHPTVNFAKYNLNAGGDGRIDTKNFIDWKQTDSMVKLIKKLLEWIEVLEDGGTQEVSELATVDAGENTTTLPEQPSLLTKDRHIERRRTARRRTPLEADRPKENNGR